MREGVASSFSLPLRDLLKKRYDSEWLNLIDGFAGGFAIDMPLSPPISSPVRYAAGTSALRLGDARVSGTVRYTPLSYWSGTVTVNKYLSAGAQQPWSPDFTYVVGYDDWHPYTLSLVYANYGGNRFNPHERQDGVRTEIEEGALTLGWKIAAPKALERAASLHRSGSIGLQVIYSATPRYTDAQGGKGRWKQRAGLLAKYGVYGNWYLTGTAYAYADARKQQPWDPDFTYGFGYFDWHPGSFSLQYNNYAGNRFWWNKHRPGGARFREGTVTLSWSWAATR